MDDRDELRRLAVRGTVRGAAAVEAAAVAQNRGRRRRLGAGFLLAGLLVAAGVLAVWPVGTDGPDVATSPTTTTSPTTGGAAGDGPATSELTDLTIEVPFAATALGEAFGSLWVVGGSIDTEESGGMGHVLRLDPVTGDVVDDIRVTGEPTDIAFSADSVWVRTAGWMSIPSGFVQISPDGTYAPIERTTETDGGIAASTMGAWVLDGVGSVEYIGGENGGYRGGLKGGELTPPLFVSARDDIAVLTSPYDGIVTVADVRGGGREIADLGVPLAGSAILGDEVWIRGNGQDNSVYVVGIADGELLDTIDLGTRAIDLLEIDAGVLALAADGATFLIDRGSRAIRTIDGVAAGAVGRGAEPNVIWSATKDSPTTIVRRAVS
ncbi:MAG: hypothetical protein RIB98_05885 [Acidimicrobiales bacterium]